MGSWVLGIFNLVYHTFLALSVQVENCLSHAMQAMPRSLKGRRIV